MINWKRLALCTLLGILLMELVIVLFTSPLLYVRNIKVTGNGSVPTADIISQVQLPPTTNIFCIGKKDIKKRILRNPVVKEVEIYRQLPDVLDVRIVERKPIFILKSNGKLYEIDASNMPYRELKQWKPQVSVVYYNVPKKIVLGKPIRTPVLNAVGETLRLAREMGISQTGKITVDLNNDLCLNVRDGIAIILGRPERLSDKLEKVARSARQFPGFWERLEYMDVTSPGEPAIKYKE